MRQLISICVVVLILGCSLSPKPPARSVSKAAGTPSISQGPATRSLHDQIVIVPYENVEGYVYNYTGRERTIRFEENETYVVSTAKPLKLSVRRKVVFTGDGQYITERVSSIALDPDDPSVSLEVKVIKGIDKTVVIYVIGLKVETVPVPSSHSQPI